MLCQSSFLNEIAPYVVVCGSFSREAETPNSDIDCFLRSRPREDVDPESGEETYMPEILAIIKKAGLVWSSVIRGHVAIEQQPGFPRMIEISSLYRIPATVQPFYRDIDGVRMLCAPDDKNYDLDSAYDTPIWDDVLCDIVIRNPLPAYQPLESHRTSRYNNAEIEEKNRRSPDMSFYDNLPQATLADLLRAYDCYISTAADAGLLTTGWTPVCVEEFYNCEYQNVWDAAKDDESFYYMYENAEAMIKSFDQPAEENLHSAAQTIAILDDAHIFRGDAGLMCRFPDEEDAHPLRSRIQDIEKGDAFLVYSGLTTALVRQAAYDSHQNLDEKDDPWIVYDLGGDCWFEEDIADAERILLALQYGKAEAPVLTGTPVNLVNIIRERASEREEWVDSFWLDAKQVPSIDLFRAAVGEFLRTKDGLNAMEASCYDFNWGDAMMSVPQEIWNKHGIYPVDLMHPPAELGLNPTPNNNPMTFTVDQDERLYPLGHSTEFTESLVFDDDIFVSDKEMHCADGYLMSTKLLRERFVAEVEPQLSYEAFWSMENINFYAVHDVKDYKTTLTATFWCTENGKETHKSCSIPLSQEEQAELASALDGYCKSRYNQDLLTFVNDWRDYHGIDAVTPSATAKNALEDQIRCAQQRVKTEKAVDPSLAKDNSPQH